MMRDVRVGLQHVLRDREALVRRPHVAPLLGDQLDALVLVDGALAAGEAIDFGRGALLAVDDDHLARAAGLFDDVLADRVGGVDAFAGDEGVARRAFGDRGRR